MFKASIIQMPSYTGSPSELSRLHNKLFGPKNDCLETSNACTNNMLNKNIDLLAFNGNKPSMWNLCFCVFNVFTRACFRHISSFNCKNLLTYYLLINHL